MAFRPSLYLLSAPHIISNVAQAVQTILHLHCTGMGHGWPDVFYLNHKNIYIVPLMPIIYTQPELIFEVTRGYIIYLAYVCIASMRGFQGESTSISTAAPSYYV